MDVHEKQKLHHQHTFTIHFNSFHFTQLHKRSMKSLKMMDESEDLIANKLKQVEHMVVDSLISAMVEHFHQ